MTLVYEGTPFIPISLICTNSFVLMLSLPAPREFAMEAMCPMDLRLLTNREVPTLNMLRFSSMRIMARGVAPGCSCRWRTTLRK